MLDGDLLLGILPADGSPISFSAVVAQLSEELGRASSESEVHSMLWALASRVTLDPATSELRLILPTNLAETIEEERDLEGWFERYLLRQAAERFFPFKPPSLSLAIENTARTSRRTGIFTIPDICMACVSRYHYSPLTHFDLFSFELKMKQGCNSGSVMQAMSYTSFAHYSYLGIYLPPDADELANLPTVCQKAQQLGVGVIHIADPFHDEGCNIMVKAARFAPEAGSIDKFIEDRFGEANRLILRKWVRP